MANHHSFKYLSVDINNTVNMVNVTQSKQIRNSVTGSGDQKSFKGLYVFVFSLIHSPLFLFLFL